MATLRTRVFDDLLVDHIELYVSDLASSTSWLADGYGFAISASAGAGTVPAPARSVALGTDRIHLVLTRPLAREHPGTAYVERHGDGVSDIALRVADATAAFDEAVRRGATVVRPPARNGGVVTATIRSFGDVRHTFVQRDAGLDERALPGFTAVAEPAAVRDIGLSHVDHFAVCLEAGGLDSTVAFYESVLDFEMVFTERIVIGSQAMNSKVVQSRSGAVTLTLIEPDTSRQPGQIDDFVHNHRGAGVQHIAFGSSDIVRAVGEITSAGVQFLDTPASYYRLLPTRLTLARHDVNDLQRLNILVDKDHDGQLFQIFSRSVHPRNTFFLEVIERLGARTFGSGNIKALYEAVELQRSKDKDSTDLAA